MYSLRITEDNETARECVQESFVKVWEQWEEGKRIENFKSYIYQAVRNASLTALKGLRREGIANSPDDMEVAEADEEAAAGELVDEEDIDTSERDARLWEAIDRLPEKCREIFLASKRDGLTNAEIAEEMGLSIKTVENQMTKAFSRLRETLDTRRDRKVFFLPFL